MEVAANTQRKTLARSLQFQRMERIVKAMQHPTAGVPVRSQKLFLTTVPNAFTGNDISEWIIEKLNVKDSNEALHLASLLCYYGYFFHVTTNGAVQIKEDNELFRFQAPYFWVSTNWTTGNIEYAIYLIKRTLRNRQRHGLEEHEVRALDDLKKRLIHQWDFITMQAEAQFRVQKDRKKTDKTIIDSQERAFWRVMRPSPEEASVLEMDIRNELYQHRSMRREDVVKRRLEYLHQALTNRVRTKSSQTHQRFSCRFSLIYISSYLSLPSLTTIRPRTFPNHQCCHLCSLYHFLSRCSNPTASCRCRFSVDLFRTTTLASWSNLIARTVFSFSLCGYAELFSDYDPFLGHCLPSNPWLSSDTDRWDLMQPLVENPTQLRVRRWSFNIKEVLSDPTGVREFMRFCKADFSTESLNFYLHVQSIRNCSLAQIKQKADFVYREHLAPNAPQEVNINDTTRTKIIRQLDNPTRDIFFEAEKHIIELMKKNSYPRFIHSEQFRHLLQTAPNPLPKKAGILHFVKDTYFRTSSSSSDDEYDSDDSTRKKGDHHTSSHPNTSTHAQHKSQPLVGTLINTAIVATAVAAATSTSIPPSMHDGKRSKNSH